MVVAASEARWLAWGRSVRRRRRRGPRRARRRQHRDARAAGTRSRTACSGARAPKASRPSRSRRIGWRRAPASSAATSCSPSTARRSQHAGRGRRVPASRHRQGTRARAIRSLRLGDAARRWTCHSRQPPRRLDVLRARAVGLFTLLVGASVRLRRPHDQATLHFFWLCVAFFGAFTFSFNGPFDRLDWVFYWGDAIAMALLPPLLLHFTLVFPERPPAARRARGAISLVPLDLPAGAGPGAGPHHRASPAARQTVRRSRAHSTLLDRAEPLYPACLCVARRGGRARRAAFGEITSLTARRQLRWIAWGTVLGVGPFALGYALPWALGVDPPLRAAADGDSARPRAAGVRVGDRPVPAAGRRGDHQARPRLHGVPGGERRPVSRDPQAGRVRVRRRRRPRTTGSSRCWRRSVVVLLAQPVKEAVQNALDRVFYRDRYDYRRALVGVRPRSEQRPRRRPSRASGSSRASSRRWSSTAWR